MSTVSISKAAKLAGISRTHFYRGYIKTGKISLSKNERNQPVIEISELLRVFITLHDGSNQVPPSNTQNGQVESAKEAILQTRVEGLEALLEAYQEELALYREREQAYLESERHFQRLLAGNQIKKRRWWSFNKS